MQLNNVIAAESGQFPLAPSKNCPSYCFCVYLRLDVNAAFRFCTGSHNVHLHLLLLVYRFVADAGIALVVQGIVDHSMFEDISPAFFTCPAG